MFSKKFKVISIKIYGNFKYCEEIFKESFIIINKIRADFKYSFLFLKQFCCNLKKMKVYKNVDDEIRGKVWKNYQENITKFKKKNDQF